MNRNLKEVLAMAMIGEGVIGSIFTEEHLLLWKGGPKLYRRFVGGMIKHPSWMRLAFAAETAAGFWLAARQVERSASRDECLPLGSTEKNLQSPAAN